MVLAMQCLSAMKDSKVTILGGQALPNDDTQCDQKRPQQ
jgi:hypothetical protein